MTYLTGSDAQQHLPRRGLGRGRLTTPEPIRAAAGLRHAVPEHSDTAVCGRKPPFLWPNPWPGGLGSVTDMCPACVEQVGLTQ